MSLLSLSTFAFVLKKNNYKDSDKIIIFLTEDYGKISAIGKFAKKSIKRNLNLLDYGYLLKIHLKPTNNRELFFVERIEFAEQIINNEDYRLFYLNSYINELLTNTIYAEEENNQKLFYLLKDFYQKNNNRNFKKIFSTLQLFRLKILETLGYKIKTDQCISCGSRINILQYSLEKKGFVCNKCKNINSVFICEGSKKVISQIDKTDYSNINFSETILTELELIFNETLKSIVTDNAFGKLELQYKVLKNGI